MVKQADKYVAKPMVMSILPDGYPDFSHLQIEYITVNAGAQDGVRFTGLAHASDMVAPTVFNSPFPGLFVRCRHLQKNNKIPDNVFKPVVQALTSYNNLGSQPLPKPSEHMYFQAICLTVNNAKLEKPAGKQCIFLAPAAKDAMAKFLVGQNKAGKDMFSPAGGYTIILKGKPPADGNSTWSFTCELGSPMPLTVELCSKLWVPWETVLIRYTQKELIQRAIACFGKDMVALAFKKEVEDIYGAQTTAPVVNMPEVKVAPVAAQPVTIPEAAKPVTVLKPEDISMDITLPEVEETGIVATTTDPLELQKQYEALLGGN
jgi:hypothetical protein